MMHDWPHEPCDVVWAWSGTGDAHFEVPKCTAGAFGEPPMAVARVTYVSLSGARLVEVRGGQVEHWDDDGGMVLGACEVLIRGASKWHIIVAGWRNEEGREHG